MSGRQCPACNITYAYELETCTFCSARLEDLPPNDSCILAVTEISAPSIGHEDVPYWCALTQTSDGRHEIVKLSRSASVGDVLPSGIGVAVETVHTVGVLGSGVMARGLAELMLSQGHHVIWTGRSLERLNSSRDKVADRLARSMDEDQTREALGRLTLSDSFSALEDCDIVIEAIVEELKPKQDVIHAVEAVVSEDCIIATNTSSLPLDKISIGMQHPERFGGLHFFNPPTRMRLVEIVRGPDTDAEVALFMTRFAQSLGKVPVPVAAGPGFVVNRVLMPLLNEAVRTLEDGIAPAEAIDEAVRLGLNHPMGPLALADLIGLDVVVSIMDDLYERLGDEAYAPRPMLRRLVSEGKLGRKTGEGFFVHTPPPVSG
jgi:3-hydroxybutyryl-CoA dehydrogenase